MARPSVRRVHRAHSLNALGTALGTCLGSSLAATKLRLAAHPMRCARNFRPYFPTFSSTSLAKRSSSWRRESQQVKLPTPLRPEPARRGVLLKRPLARQRAWQSALACQPAQLVLGLGGGRLKAVIFTPSGSLAAVSRR